MSKKLSNLKRKNLRCLIVEDFETGEVYKFIKEDEINKAIGKYTESEITKVYNPTPEQIKMINALMDRDIENGKATSNLNSVDMLLNVIPMLTDIEIDLDIEEDKDVISEIIANPNELLNEVLLEINKILVGINLDWINGLKLLNKLPSEVIDALVGMNNGGK